MSTGRKARPDHTGRSPARQKPIEGKEPRTWCATCDKTGWPGQSSAKKAAQSIGRVRGQPRMRAYRCPVNRALWHLTSQARYGGRDG